MAQNPMIGIGPQPEQPGQGLSANSGNLALLGFGAAGFAATGFVPIGKERMWDKYLSGIRAVETGFPGAILRTFRTSEFLSPLESWSRLNVSPYTMEKAGKYSSFLKNTFGVQATKGLTLTKTGQIFGDVKDAAGKTIGLGLNLQAGTQKGAAIADYYARLSGIDLGLHESLNEALLRTKWAASGGGLSYGEWLDAMEPHLRQQRLIVGARLREKINVFGHNIYFSKDLSRSVAKAETTGKLLRAKAASTAGRLNILLTKPLEVPVIGEALSKVPFIRSMVVKPGSNLQILGRLTKKALIAGAAWKGLEYVDYLRSEESPLAPALTTIGGAALGAFIGRKPGMKFSKAGMAVGTALGLFAGTAPRFNEGLFYGAASIWADTNVTRAQLSQTTGLTSSLQEQEEVTPGLHSLSTALGFAGVGALAVSTGDYLSFFGKSIREKLSTGRPLAHIFEQTREATKTKLADRLFSSQLGQKISKIPGLKKIKSPALLGAIGGLLAWQGISSLTSILSGNFLAALPGAGIVGTQETPEELEAIYSGEQEVAIRKGRWWEMGRCIGARCNILTNNGYKFAENITLEDKLLARDGNFVDVKQIYTRNHNDLILNITTALNRNYPTILTPEHKVPRLRVVYNSKNNTPILEEVCASELTIHDYVEVPIINLQKNLSVIKAKEFIKAGLYLEDNKYLFPAQINWYTKKLQRSRGVGIPKEIYLNDNIGRLFGYYLAEGNISFNENNLPCMVEFAFSIHEQHIINDIVEICKTEFNTTPTVRHKKTGKKTKEGCLIVRICNSLLSRVFFELFHEGIRKDKNKNSYKIFPLIFLETSSLFKEQLIEGYWLGDGCLDRKRRSIKSARKQLVDYTAILLLSFGYCPTVPIKETTKYTKQNGKLAENYKISWTHDKPYQNQQSFFWYNGKLYTQIIDISREEYNGIVYDFEIDHSDHLFQAGTFLVHNSSKYSGGRIDYFRPHFIHRLKTRAYQKGIYGDEAEKWEYDPTIHPIKALFGSDEWKYHYEEKYQYERPAVLSSTYFEEIPFIGPALAATFGKVLKPRKYIRPEEWMYGKEPGEGVVHRPDVRGETEPSYILGGETPGAPVQPDEPSQLLNQLVYKRREAVGLIGFVEGAVTKSLLGREEVLPNLTTLSTMGKERGSEYWLWKHLNLAGALGTSEPVRRFIPRTPSYLETYNPLRNTMPSWMPDEYFLDLKYGNPFDKIPESELRLPGSAGIEALHPELKGVSPENYPLAYRVKILGDIAMWSDEYKRALRSAKSRMGDFSPREQKIIEETERQVKEKKKRREFAEYRFNQDMLKQQEVTVKEVISPRRFITEELGGTLVDIQGLGAIPDQQAALEFAKDKLEGKKINLAVPALESRRFDFAKAGPRLKAVPLIEGKDLGAIMTQEGLAEPKQLEDEFEQIRFSKTQQLAGRISEYVLHGIESPLEYLTPISPAAKLIRQRSAIEEYIKSEAIGTSNAFWDKPVENFLTPTANMSLYKMGMTDIPDDVQEKRDIQEYFDMLKWVKFSRLEKKAYLVGDVAAAKEFKKQKASTVFGVDVFKSPISVLKALPRTERDFFDAFSNAKTSEEQAQILSLLPENEKRVYASQWIRQAAGASQAKVEAGISSDEDLKTIEAARSMRKSEGFAYQESDIFQWYEETAGRQPFDEWIREKKAEEYFQTHSLPGASWLGWSPSTQIEDVKLQYVEQAGLDHHDFDLWGQRKRALARKPYINTELIQQMNEDEEYQSPFRVAKNSEALAKMYSDWQAEIQMSRVDAQLGEDRYDIDVRDGRRDLIEKAYREMGA